MTLNGNMGFRELLQYISAARSQRNLQAEDCLLQLAESHKSSSIRRSALVALRELRSDRVWPLLISLLATELDNENLRETAIKSLGELGGPETRSILLRVSETERVARFGRQAAHNALKRLETRLSKSTPESPSTTAEARDIFLCHAGEDKKAIVEPLIEVCQRTGISCWYDRAEIRWGDSITKKINEGLMLSRYVVAIISKAFLGKNWPERELNAVINLEAQTGAVKLLLLLAGSPADQASMFQRFPLLNDKLYIVWDGNADVVVRELKARLKQL